MEISSLLIVGRNHLFYFKFWCAVNCFIIYTDIQYFDMIFDTNTCNVYFLGHTQ